VCFASLGVELCRREKGLGVLGVVRQDVGAELHLAARLIDALDRVQCRELGEVIDVSVVDPAGILTMVAQSA